MKKIVATILAAGMGKRMESDIPKVLHNVGSIPMIVRIIEQVLKLNPDKIIIVVGKHGDMIKDTVNKYNYNNIEFCVQNDPKGTGDAVKSSLYSLQSGCINIILNGDVPLLKYSTIKKIIDNHIKGLTVTAIKLENPTGNGRIVESNGKIIKIVEEKDCNTYEKLINLVNCGIYIVDSDVIIDHINKLNNDNAQKEYYLTDMVSICIDNNIDVTVYVLPDDKSNEILNVNTKDQLSAINSIIESEQKN